MYKEKDFYKTQNKWSKYRQENYKHGKCDFQAYDMENGILCEGWTLINNEGKQNHYIIKIFTNDNGFYVFEWKY